MMSSKGQVYGKITVDFISKTEGPVYFEQVGTLSYMKRQTFTCINKALTASLQVCDAAQTGHKPR